MRHDFPDADAPTSVMRRRIFGFRAKRNSCFSLSSNLIFFVRGKKIWQRCNCPHACRRCKMKKGVSFFSFPLHERTHARTPKKRVRTRTQFEDSANQDDIGMIAQVLHAHSLTPATSVRNLACYRQQGRRVTPFTRREALAVLYL